MNSSYVHTFQNQGEVGAEYCWREWGVRESVREGERSLHDCLLNWRENVRTHRNNNACVGRESTIAKYDFPNNYY